MFTQVMGVCFSGRQLAAATMWRAAWSIGSMVVQRPSDSPRAPRPRSAGKHVAVSTGEGLVVAVVGARAVKAERSGGGTASRQRTRSFRCCTA